ncbi:MAG: biotin--[acetyl-CoA-carboxylase] ligase [Thermoleophilaceae bacterium]
MSGLGRPRVHHRTVDSTNERAKALAHFGAPHGTVVTADAQAAGRGRQGRAWIARSGGALLMSLLIRGLEERHAILPLTAAVSVCEAAEACAPVTCAIKWPNDVWIERRKLAGILIEVRPQEGWAVVGVGLNVCEREFPGELKGTATSLALESPGAGAQSPEQALGELLICLERRLAEPAAKVLEAWRGRDALYGRQIAWNGGEGTAAGIDDSGDLLADTVQGRVALEAGEVHLARVG